MDTLICLIRHAAHAQLGTTLSGRMPGLSLSAGGMGQAQKAAARLSSARVVAIHTSPVARARETAAAIALPHGLEPEVVDALDELDFGSWTGRSFVELEREQDWMAWNTQRGSARIPGGETMAGAQARIVDHISALGGRVGGGALILVSHCDLIRAAIAHYLGLALDRMLSFDVDPASMSRLAVGKWGGRVLSVNEPLA